MAAVSITDFIFSPGWNGMGLADNPGRLRADQWGRFDKDKRRGAKAVFFLIQDLLSGVFREPSERLHWMIWRCLAEVHIGELGVTFIEFAGCLP
jgi:hypothetical protein